MKQVGKQDLIDDFNRVAEELGKKPTLTEYNEHGEYSSTPIYKRFESFEALKEQAGFETGQQKIDDETLLEDLQRVADEIGRTPPVEVYDEHGEHNHKTLKKRWGSWYEVLEKAGLDPTNHSEHWEGVEYNYEPLEGNVVVECDHCGEETKKWEHQLESVEKVFCDHQCKARHMSEQKGEQARSWEGGKVEVRCEICGGTKKVRPAKANKTRFCSRQCKGTWVSNNTMGEDHPRWNPDKEYLYYGPNWSEQRQAALERDGYECRVCGMGKERHRELFGSVHDVHHIHKFKTYDSHEKANRLENLTTLCMRCHQHVENGNVSIPASQWHREKCKEVFASR